MFESYATLSLLDESMWPLPRGQGVVSLGFAPCNVYGEAGRFSNTCHKWIIIGNRIDPRHVLTGWE